MQFAASWTLLVALSFLANNLSRSYLISDLGILLINKDDTDEQRWAESANVYIIALQACFAAAIAIISIPMNILMIMMIMCHCLLDKAFIISIFFLTASWKLVVALSFLANNLSQSLCMQILCPWRTPLHPLSTWMWHVTSVLRCHVYLIISEC